MSVLPNLFLWFLSPIVLLYSIDWPPPPIETSFSSLSWKSLYLLCSFTQTCLFSLSLSLSLSLCSVLSVKKTGHWECWCVRSLPFWKAYGRGVKDRSQIVRKREKDRERKKWRVLLSPCMKSVHITTPNRWQPRWRHSALCSSCRGDFVPEYGDVNDCRTVSEFAVVVKATIMPYV